MPGPDETSHLVLQVPVPTLEGFVRARHAHHDPAYVSSDPDFGTREPVPHLTLDHRDEVSAGELSTMLTGQVPARCRAERLDLARWGAGVVREGGELAPRWPDPREGRAAGASY